jgi:hypothetical protein
VKNKLDSQASDRGLPAARLDAISSKIRLLPYLSTYNDLAANFGWSRTRAKALARHGEIEVIHDKGRAFFVTETALAYIERLRAEKRNAERANDHRRTVAMT